MSAWKQVKCSLCNKHLTHLGSQNILSFSVDTESNETELENLEQRAWCVLCKQVLQQSSSAWLLSRLPLSGTRATGHWLLPVCQHHAHPWSRGSGGFPGFLGSVAWVVHLRFYFHIIFTIPVAPWGEVLLHVNSGCLYTKGITNVQEGHI